MAEGETRCAQIVGGSSPGLLSSMAASGFTREPLHHPSCQDPNLHNATIHGRRVGWQLIFHKVHFITEFLNIRKRKL